MAAAAVDRFGTTLAPGELGLVHRLLNSTSTPGKPDLLCDLSPAQAWLDEALAGWAVVSGETAPGLKLNSSDLAPLRNLRTIVQDALLHRTDRGSSGRRDLSGSIEVTLGHEGAVIATPRGKGVLPWMRSAVLLACLNASLTGKWSRLKICANPDCSLAFYDRSRNRSGAWHDVRVCGNLVNLRASRARRRVAA